MAVRFLGQFLLERGVITPEQLHAATTAQRACNPLLGELAVGRDDALRSERPYKPALSHEDSMLEMRRECGTQFNPALCDAFFHCAEEIRHIYEMG